MISKKQEAAALTTAPNNHRQKKSYQSVLQASSKNIRDDMGELLWSLQFSVGSEHERIGWGLLERLLRRYVGRKYPSNRLAESLKSTISSRGISG